MANIDGLPTVSGSKQPDSTAEMQQLSDDFHSVLKITEEVQSGSPSSRLTDSLDHSDDDAAEDEALWREFCNFMDKQARECPFPKYLYRAHVHGHPFPRVPDACMGKDSDSFASDFHLWLEHDAESQIPFPMCDLTEIHTVDSFFSELNLHLNKTNVNLEREREGKEPFLSSLVSLSGDFRWTAQRICQVGRKTNEDQIPGLAVFKTAIDPSTMRIWRVKDMLFFLDTKLPNSSVDISSQLRRWAANADEYVCWEVIPEEALVTFIPLPELTEAPDDGERAFLKKEFVASNFLGDFRLCPLEHLSLGEYTDRVSNFVRNIITDISSLEEAEQLVMYIAWVLSEPNLWGYYVAGFADNIDAAISSTLKKALKTAFVIR